MSSDSLKNGILSFIIPGLGQGLNGNKQKGIIFLGIAVILHLFIWFFMNNPFGSAVSTFYHIYAGYDAYKTS